MSPQTYNIKVSTRGEHYSLIVPIDGLHTIQNVSIIMASQEDLRLRMLITGLAVNWTELLLAAGWCLLSGYFLG